MKKYIAKGFLKGEPFEIEDEAADIGSFNQYLRIVYPSFEIKEIREVGWKNKSRSIMRLFKFRYERDILK